MLPPAMDDELQPGDRVQIVRDTEGTDGRDHQTFVMLEDANGALARKHGTWHELWHGRTGTVKDLRSTDYVSVDWEERFIDGKRIVSDGGGWSTECLRRIAWPDCDCGSPIFAEDDYLCARCRARV